MNRDIQELREVVQKLVPLLAGKGLTVTQRGSQAYVQANPKTRVPELVNIPNIPDTAEPSFIRAIQGFIDHEIGHVLVTDWNYYGRGSLGDDLRKPEVQNFVSTHNIVEDTMIEREMAKIFPGSERNISDLRRHFIEKITKRALAGAKDDKERFIYLLVPAMRALAGHPEFVEFMDDGKHWENLRVKEMVSRFKPATLDLLKKCSTTKETLAIAEELHQILHPAGMSPPAPPAPPPPPPPAPKKEKKKPEPKPEPEEDEEDGPEPEEEKKAAPKPKPAKEEEGDAEPDSDEDEDDGDAEDDADEKPEPDEDDDEDEELEPAGPGDGDEERDHEEEGEDDQNDGAAPAPASGDDDDEEEPADPDEDEDDADAGLGSDGAEEDDGDADGLSGLEGARVTTDGDDGGGVGNIDTEEEDDEGESGGGGVGNEAAKSLFDYDEDAFNECDLSSQISILISEEAVLAMDPSQYNVFTREMDDIKPIDPPTIDDKWVPKMEDEVRSMTGRMQKDIERMMASQSHVIRTPGHRRGRLHAPSLYRIGQGDPRVFSQREEHVSKDTAISLVCDNSGSMGGPKMKLAMTAAYALSTTLDRVKINHEVIGFTTGSYHNMPQSLREAWQNEAETSNISWDRIEPIVMPIYKEFGERITATVKKRFAYMMFAQRGLNGNVDGESLEYAAMRLMKQREKRKVMIVLSDGQPAGSGKSGPHLSYMVQRLIDAGIEVMGIGIKSTAVKRFYKHHVVLDDIDTLPTQVMQELRRILA